MAIRSPLRRMLASRSEVNEGAWRLIERFTKPPELESLYFVERNPFFDPRTDRYLDRFPVERFRSRQYFERVAKLDQPVLFEPVSGRAVVARSHRCLRVGTSRPDRSPGFRRYAQARLARRPLRRDAVLSLRDPWELNYSHTLIDLFGGRLRLAGEVSELDAAPLLVGRTQWEQPFFRQLFERSGVSDREVIVHDRPVVVDRHIAIDNAHFGLDAPSFLQHLLRIPAGDRDARRRIFLTRPTGRAGRGLTNMSELAEVFDYYGFSVVSTDAMSIEGQIELFSSARYVVAVHGAGLTNLIYRRDAPASVLEIFPPGAGPSLRAAFFMICCALGLEYFSLLPPAPELLGQAAYRRDFALDPELLRTSIERLLAT